MFLVTSIFRLLILSLTDISMFPAILLIQRNHRHFELYIGIFHFLSKLFYNSCQALQINIFLDEGDWHFISDVLGLSYFSLLVVHLISSDDENHAHLLRYLGFSLSWIVKIKDQWDSVFYEAILIFVMFGLVVWRYSQPVAPKLDKENGLKLVFFVGLGSLAYLILETAEFNDRTRSQRILHAVISGFLNVCAGGTMFYGWKTVPIKDYRSIKSMV